MPSPAACHQHLYKKDNRCRAGYCLTSGFQISANVQENIKQEEFREIKIWQNITICIQS